MIKTEPVDDYETRMRPRLYYGQQRAPAAMPVDETEPCLVPAYAPCQSAPIHRSSPDSSPKLHDLSPVPFNKCLSNSSPTHSMVHGGMQDPHTHPGLAMPSSPESSIMTLRHPRGSPHLGSPSYHALYPSSSPSSSPGSHPSTPGANSESPFLPVFGSAQPLGSPVVLPEERVSPEIPVSVKQEPQEIDQMYLDDGRSDCVVWFSLFKK